MGVGLFSQERVDRIRENSLKLEEVQIRQWGKKISLEAIKRFHSQYWNMLPKEVVGLTILGGKNIEQIDLERMTFKGHLFYPPSLHEQDIFTRSGGPEPHPI